MSEADSPSVWLSLIEGLTPHGLRHSHKTWMLEDAVPEVLQAERLGHTVPGMRGVYSHVSDTMPVPVLNELWTLPRSGPSRRGYVS